MPSSVVSKFSVQIVYFVSSGWSNNVFSRQVQYAQFPNDRKEQKSDSDPFVTAYKSSYFSSVFPVKGSFIYGYVSTVVNFSLFPSCWMLVSIYIQLPFSMLYTDENQVMV